MSPLMERLGVKYPLFQGGMAWVADGKLAASVSEAGGLGIIGSGHAPASWVKEQIDIAKSLTDKAFGVNVMLLSPFVEQVIDVIVDAKVALVTTGAGDPSRYLERLQQNGTIVMPVVPSVAMAKRMAKDGVDGVIAEGMESGGHIGSMTTMALVPQVVDAVDIPVVAAGGIADGRGVAAALSLGAIGVQMGTRFLTSTSSRIHQNYKDAVIKAKDVDTLVTGLYVGHAARVLKNPMSRNFLKLEKKIALSDTTDFSAVEELGNGSLRKAVLEGDREHGSFMAGEIAGLVKREESSEDIVEDVMRQAKEILAGSKMAALLTGQVDVQAQA